MYLTDLYKVPKAQVQVQVPEMQVRVQVQVPRSQVQVRAHTTPDQVQPKTGAQTLSGDHR